jgi:glycerol kinase
MPSFLLAIDQGTTSTRTMIFDAQANLVSSHQIALQQYFPQTGWVEHDGEEIWQATLSCCQNALEKGGLLPQDIAGIGITNQRETTLIWDKQTGIPIYSAIVWQDRRTAALCETLREAGHQAMIRSKTGLLLDPYFSASKIRWLLDHVPQAQKAAALGTLAFGTVDSFLLWRLTDGVSHATDATNASRTLLFNIHTQQWDPELLRLFNIPDSILPKVVDSMGEFGHTHPRLLGAKIPILAMAGDQQAALIGQTCFEPGMVKSTYGTGTFMMLNTGSVAISSQNQLLTTLAYRIKGVPSYALEGSVFSTGSTIQWLRDNLGLIKNATETAEMAASLTDNGGVYFIPAFTGLGAPYWAPHVRANIQGITRGTQPAHIVRAALEAVAYQTRDLLEAMKKDSQLVLKNMKVDGGMVQNNWLMQFLADILELPITRCKVNETTALGIAYLAGLQAGIFSSFEKISDLWQSSGQFDPQQKTQPKKLYQGWKDAIKRIL